MTDSGATPRLPEVPSPSSSQPVTITRTAPDAHSSSNAPWLTGSAYARQITDEAGQLRVRPRPAWRRWLRRAFLLVVVLIPVSIMLVGAAVYWEAHTGTANQADAIVVLGAAQYNGRPSEVFRARLDHALNLYQEGYAPLIVLTGGKQPGDAYTEAETGEQYLLDRGVPASSLRFENQGRDTWQSMRGVAEVLDGSGAESLLIVSDGFHLLRSELMARELGFTAYGSAAAGSPIQSWSGAEFAYVIRETGGILAFVPTMVGIS
ncbi:MAG: YdcF family protein [Chloroflexota bacterium]|nr:YdcF family protein [Chloroflexota bacterium]